MYFVLFISSVYLPNRFSNFNFLCLELSFYIYYIGKETKENINPCQLSIHIIPNFSAHHSHINSTITWHNYLKLKERVENNVDVD